MRPTTPRRHERFEVLRLIAAGKANKNIADLLSNRTHAGRRSWSCNARGVPNRFEPRRKGYLYGGLGALPVTATSVRVSSKPRRPPGLAVLTPAAYPYRLKPPRERYVYFVRSIADPDRARDTRECPCACLNPIKKAPTSRVMRPERRRPSGYSAVDDCTGGHREEINSAMVVVKGHPIPPWYRPVAQEGRPVWVMKKERSGTRTLRRLGVPNGTRTRVTAVKGRCPRPLDDGDEPGRPCWNRTSDILLKRQALYLLS